uniref:glycoside hydrolase family 16 protein n=2 Tax=Roseivirga sp. TaxID=1964215 RepID=UPI004047C0A5
MKVLKLLLAFLICFTMVACGGSDDLPTNTVQLIPTEGFVSPESYPNMTLVWEDDFEGTSLDPANWTYEIGTGQSGWGNNELQYYTANNTSIVDGHLVITAKREALNGSDYTSSRIVTQDKRNFQYGRIDIRAALPQGQGIWPALWMLGSNFPTVGWPASGEIDIMEMVGGNGRENTIHGTVHWQNEGQHAEYGGSRTLPTSTFIGRFYVFSIVWTESSIAWLVNNNEFHRIDTTPAELDEFRNEFFFIFNLAVGGNWPGNPDNTTNFPQRLIVDYVRVFQNN